MAKYTPVRCLHNFKASVAYKGTAYKGWQTQRGGQATIQRTIEKAISQLKQEPAELLDIQSAGRTDAGVHARGQVFNFYSHTLAPPPDRLSRAINTFLPGDIRVTAVEQVPMDFHARHSALSKTYSFHVHQGPIADPLLSGLSQHVFQDLDISLMQAATKVMEGTHDFTQFASIGHKDYEVSGVKTLTSMQVQRVTGGLEMVFSGTGFLYNQCRHMAGCLISVGKGAMSIEAVQELLFIGRQGGVHGAGPLTESSNLSTGLRHRPWALAQAGGLYLEQVRYPQRGCVDDLLHPEAPHDAQGRIDFSSTDPQERIAIVDIMRRKKTAQLAELGRC